MKKRVVSIFLLSLYLIVAVPGCSDTDDGKIFSSPDSGEISDGDEPVAAEFFGDGDIEKVKEEENPDETGDSDIEPLKNVITFESNFIHLEKTDYTINFEGEILEYEASPARMWYSFQPADENPEDKPIFVFFNGGPGSSTVILMGFNTGKRTLDPGFTGGEPFSEHDANWTRFGNLLYVDARQTGFSYDLTDDLSYEYFSDEYSERNFNPMIDGADFVKTVLRFLDKHPELKDNEVIITGESYGGTRSAAMLNMLLFYSEYDENSLFFDEDLNAEIEEHFQEIYPEYEGKEVPPEAVAKQFARQIQIQPFFYGWNQYKLEGDLLDKPGSPIYQIAEEEGEEYVPCATEDVEAGQCFQHDHAIEFVQNKGGRDPYCYSRENGWNTEIYSTVLENLLNVQIFEQFLGVEAEDVSLMFNEERANAIRTTRNYYMPEKSFKETFGELGEFDTYFIPLNTDVNRAFSANNIDYFKTWYGEMFIENLVYMDTFITQAAKDLVVYTAAIPLCMIESDYVSNVIVDDNSFQVHFASDAFDFDVPSDKRVAFPLYSESGHAVTMFEPEKFADDVEKWLQGDL